MGLGSLVSGVEAPFRWIGGKAKTVIEELIPSELEAKVGMFAHTFTANLVHDFGDLAHTLTHEAVSDIWAALEQTAASLAPDVLSGKVSFAKGLEAAVAALKSDAAKVLLPTLEHTSAATIQSWVGPLVSTALAAASANPMPAQASSPVGSSQGSSKA